MNSSNLTKEEHFANALEYFELVVVGVIMISICALTVIGNTLVLLSFMLDKKLRTLNNYFLLSLAVSDFMVATFSMPLFTLYTLEGEWVLGPVLCDMWLAQDYMSCTASGLNLLIISFDRYLSITRPLKYRAKRNSKHVLSMIACVWFLAFVLWPPWVYAWPYIEGRRTVPADECYIQFLETSTYVTVVTAVMSYYIPVTIMCCLYFCVWRETEKRKVYLAVMKTGGEFGSEKLRKHHKKKCFMFCCGDWLVKGSHPYKGNVTKLPSNNRSSTVNEALTKTLIIQDECNLEEGCQKAKGPFVHDSNETNESLQLNASAESKPAASQKISSKQDNKAARTLTAVSLAFLVTVTPYNVLVLIRNIDGTHSLVPDALWNFFYFTVYVNSTLNPVCYALANKNFKETYWKIITCSWDKNVAKKSSYSLQELNTSQNKSSSV